MQLRRVCGTLLLAFSLVLVGSAAWAANPAYSIQTGQLSCPDSPRAREFIAAALDSTFNRYLLLGGSSANADTVRCGCQATNGGMPVKGVKVTFDVDLLDINGDTSDLTNAGGRTRRNGWFTTEANVPNDTAGAVVTAISLGGRKPMDELDCYCAAGTPSNCQPDNQTLCLDGGRFEVDAFFNDPNDHSEVPATVVQRGGNQGIFQFFPINAELLVQILDNCADPNFSSFWVFAAASTDVAYDITVTDTWTGESRTYGNQLGLPAQAITDTAAFSTCP